MTNKCSHCSHKGHILHLIIVTQLILCVILVNYFWLLPLSARISIKENKSGKVYAGYQQKKTISCFPNNFIALFLQLPDQTQKSN